MFRVNKTLNELFNKNVQFKIADDVEDYEKEIKELNHLGLGSNRISKELKLKYKVNISPSTIYRYLRGLENG